MMDALQLQLWVSNQVGVDYDATEAYIEATAWTPPSGVSLDGPILSGEDAETVFAAFLALASAVEQVGHGDLDGDPVSDLPCLTACPVDLINEAYTSAEESLARLTSREHLTYSSWAAR